ncbi:hypothetical protein, conserved [Trypanosoma cruzi]|uniref:Uncharacterized protein n=1 Tax=Trypanosoma cruzi (strain CL Brener) TaxID=353153 RepID=Q4CVI8_TRYCC|nr:hypothetical protein, conserved [Trypanosoma cruzi]EAN84288.1 hypothetical protein, conserved [Trypanosoma cruzi]|eukprot:XP_806139.1 hypothetical protein [Trypanosoma cruzi strain CL Brener]
MSKRPLAICGVLGGCQANVFLLKLIIVRSPNTLYAMTFVQYVVVSLLSIFLVSNFFDSSRGGGWLRIRLRPMRILTSHKLILASSSWLMSVSSNLVFGLYISVPLHATFRSSSLLLNMLAGYFFLEKRYTRSQVLCATAISGGLIALAMEKSRKVQNLNAENGMKTSEGNLWWFLGLTVLACTTAFSTGLGIFQEYMYAAARRREEETKKRGESVQSSLSPPPMWAEALFFSHIISIPLFFLQSGRLFREFASISSDSYMHFALNALTQYVCITGVYILNDKTSAFTLILTLTLRKLCTFSLSVAYFGHYRHFTMMEWVAMVTALAAGALYPLLPKAHPPSNLCVKPTEKGSKER